MVTWILTLTLVLSSGDVRVIHPEVSFPSWTACSIEAQAVLTERINQGARVIDAYYVCDRAYKV